MGRRLTDSLAGVTLAVLDFEYTTPTGAPPEPIEVAVQTLHARDGELRRGWTWQALIRPPEHAALTPFDTHQTGITATMLADRPPAAQVLAALDAQFTDIDPLVLVAHSASAEGRILYDQRAHCPHLAHTDLLDTVRLARDRHPDLLRHNLDTLAAHLRIPVPAARHRAMPDVQLTVDVLLALINNEIHWPDLRALRTVAGYPARAAQPEQGALFG
ncbi:MAG: 3'-5' exonuclease [Pseudonocardia sp.]|nr:3'-5' exonuclease [Pseudonocardia sp.]